MFANKKNKEAKKFFARVLVLEPDKAPYEDQVEVNMDAVCKRLNIPPVCVETIWEDDICKPDIDKRFLIITDSFAKRRHPVRFNRMIWNGLEPLCGTAIIVRHGEGKALFQSLSDDEIAELTDKYANWMTDEEKEAWEGEIIGGLYVLPVPEGSEQ